MGETLKTQYSLSHRTSEFRPASGEPKVFFDLLISALELDGCGLWELDSKNGELNLVYSKGLQRQNNLKQEFKHILRKTSDSFSKGDNKLIKINENTAALCLQDQMKIAGMLVLYGRKVATLCVKLEPLLQLLNYFIVSNVFRHNFFPKENKQLQKLGGLMRIGSMLNSTLKLDDILNTLLTETINLINAADAGLLFIYNPERGKLVVKSMAGFASNDVCKMAVRPGESITGKTFQAKKSMLFSNPEDVWEGMGNILPDNLLHYQQSLPREHSNIRSAMTTPLWLKGECIGVMVVDNFSTDASFTLEDLELLEAIANQAAIAIENAQVYKREKETADKLLHSLNIHKLFTRLTLEGKGTKEIAQTLGSLLKKPVVIYDYFLKPKSFYWHDSVKKEQSHQFIEHFQIDVLLSDKRNSKKPLYLTYSYLDCKKTAYVVPVSAREYTIGWLVVLDVFAPLKELDLTAIEHASTVLALELIRENSVHEVEQRFKGDLLDELLNGECDERMIERASYFGFNKEKKYQVIIADINKFFEYVNRPEMEESQVINLKKAMLELVNIRVTKFYPNSIVIGKSDRIIIMMALKVVIGKEEAKNLAIKLVQEVEKEVTRYFPGIAFRFGIGRLFKDLNDFKKSFSDANMAIEINKTFGHGDNIVYYGDLGAKKLIFSNDPVELKEFIEEVFGKLYEYEKGDRGELFKTLKIYIETNANWKETAQRMHIHGNTLNYRLKRIREITNLDLHNREDWLQLQLGYEILKLMGNT